MSYNQIFRHEHEIAVSRRIYQLCGLLQLDHPSKERLNPLQDLQLQDFVIVLTFIAGLEGEMSWATGRPSKSIKLRNEELHTYITKAYRVFEDWPHNFHQFLHEKSRGDVRFNPRDGKLDTGVERRIRRPVQTAIWRSPRISIRFSARDFCPIRKQQIEGAV